MDADGLPDVWERSYGLDDTLADHDMDLDEDGLTNAGEFAAGTNPAITDTDSDGVSDHLEISLYASNPLSEDSDDDGFSDGEEVSAGTSPMDGDRFPGWYEASLKFKSIISTLKPGGGWVQSTNLNAFQAVGQNYSTYSLSNFSHIIRTDLLPSAHGPSSNPQLEDRDGDSMPDLWEEAHGLDSYVDDSSLDGDVDGLSNLEEFLAQSNPWSVDTDADGVTDYQEVETFGSSPILEDTDGDGFSDLIEVQEGTDPSLVGSYPGSTPPPVYLSGLNTRNAGGGWATGGGYRRFSSLGQPFADGISKSSAGIQFTGFTFMANPPSGHFNQFDADADSIPDLDERILGTSVVDSDLHLDSDSDGLSNADEFSNGTNPKLADTDMDGLSDYEELNTHGSDPLNEDSDADSFSDGDEVASGSDLLTSSSYPGSDRITYISFAHSINGGGNSDPTHEGLNLSSIGQSPEARIIANSSHEIRSGFMSLFGMLPEVNNAPANLQFNEVVFNEGMDVGTLVGVLSATDADTDDLLRYELLAGEGDSGNHWFVLDANGSLYSSTIFDYETNATQYAIRARALDEANASVEGNFTVSLLNVVEDLDGDGVEDFYDLDDDGDGYSDAEEVAYGSDPRDAASVANAQPVGLSAVGGLQIMENQSVGTLVGVLSATDADTDDLLRYELLAGEGDSGNHWFVLDANGSLYSSTIFDYETNATQYAIRARALDEANASVEGNFTVSLLNVVEDLDGDGVEDFYDLDDDGDGYSDAEEVAYGSDPRDAASVANAPTRWIKRSGRIANYGEPISWHSGWSIECDGCGYG